MITTHQIKISNNKEYVTLDQMFKLLYISSHLIKTPTDYYSSDQSTTLSRTLFNKIASIFISNKIFEFISERPYIRSVNLHKIVIKLRNNLGLNWYYNNNLKFLSDYKGIKNYFNKKDYKINLLYDLFQRGMYFENFEDIPRELKKFTTIVLYIDYYLNRMFEHDYQVNKMEIFSTNPKIRNSSRFSNTYNVNTELSGNPNYFVDATFRYYARTENISSSTTYTISNSSGTSTSNNTSFSIGTTTDNLSINEI